jgi:hypothetical protein
MKSLISTISDAIIKGMVIVMVAMKEGILLLSDAKISSITICFPASKGAVKLRILPVNGKNHFAVQLFTED